MLLFVSHVLIVLAGLLAVPVFVFFLEIVAGLILPARDIACDSGKGIRPRVAILVPAHNESAGLGLTLENIKPQLVHGDRLLVVADNCSDDTAAVAAAAGAEVIARNDPTNVGKGYALDFGLKHLSLAPPEIVIVIDADCRIAEGTIDRLAATCAMTHRPAQALYLMTAQDESPINYHVAEFAWRVKNWARLAGLNALKLPCQLVGSGMAIPWELIRFVELASGSIVEDVKLGLDLAKSGHSAVFCPSAKVTSQFPWSKEGAQSQRKRWEEGHIGMIRSVVPRSLYHAITRRNHYLFVLALDLMVPPLSLLIVLITGMYFITGAATLLGCAPTALFISAACVVAMILAVFLSWVKYGRDVLPPRRLYSVATFVFAKLPLYGQLLFRRSVSQWIRTDRSNTRVVPARPAIPPSIDP